MERTITLVWDEAADSWRDKYSNQKIAVIPPGMTLVWTDGPSQPSTDHRSIKLALTPEQVQEMINDAFRNRTSQASTMAYFAPPDDSLVTYGAIRNDIVDFYTKLSRIMWRIEQLERPWYKRWFGR